MSDEKGKTAVLSEFSPILAAVFAGLYAVFSIPMLEHSSALAAATYPTLFAAPVTLVLFSPFLPGGASGTAFFSEDLEPDGGVVILLGVYLACRRWSGGRAWKGASVWATRTTTWKTST